MIPEGWLMSIKDNDSFAEIRHLRAANERLRAALARITAVQLDEPPPLTDPDWKARLMQGIARLTVEQLPTTEQAEKLLRDAQHTLQEDRFKIGHRNDRSGKDPDPHK